MSLAKAILSLQTEEEIDNFFNDILTPKEYDAIKERFEIVKLLYFEHLSYREIHQKTGASLTTIGRVARFLNHEPYKGYLTVLKRYKESS